MKKTFIICLVLVLINSGCTPKSQVYSSALDTLERVEKVCNEISDDVKRLDDKYTTDVFENIKKSTAEYRDILSDTPSKDDIEHSLSSLLRLEKELSSIKMLSGGIDNYIPELTFDFINHTESIVEKVILLADDKEQLEVFSGEIAIGQKVTISYPVEDGDWSLTAFLHNGDEITGEGISLSTMNSITLNEENGNYLFLTN